MATTPAGGFHRRPLPAPAVAFSSAEGRVYHKQALAEGNMECFFKLIENFLTQAEPAFCGIGTLANALNALEMDPGQIWKGSWRWYSEEMLSCCVAIDEISNRGITFDEFGCLARCNGLDVTSSRATDATVEEFRSTVLAACKLTDAVLCVSYSRRPLNQTGDGHFSPIGGYHAASDRVLVLDVARFKYPPHWIGLADLFEAMLPLDKTTGKSRGFFLMTRSNKRSSPIQVQYGPSRLRSVDAFLEKQQPCSSSKEEQVWGFLRELPASAAALVRLTEYSDLDTDFFAALRETPLHAAIAEAARLFQKTTGPISLGPDAATVLLFVLDSRRSLASSFPGTHALLFDLTEPLQSEIEQANADLDALYKASPNQEQSDDSENNGDGGHCSCLGSRQT